MLLLAALLAASAAAEVTVRVNGGSVDLTARAAPLAEVLDQLARQTGMRVVYEGPPPRPPVTLSLQGRTPTEAVLSVLEGMGVNFALVADPSGSRVETLFVTGASAAAAPSPAASRPAPAPTRPRMPLRAPPGVPSEPAETDFEEPEDLGAEDAGFSGLPPGVQLPDPNETPAEAGAAEASPGAEAAPPVTIPSPQMPRFPASPFAPQAEPFPPVPSGVPQTPPQAPANPPGSTPEP